MEIGVPFWRPTSYYILVLYRQRHTENQAYSIWFVSGLGVYLVPQLADIYSHFHYVAREYVFVHNTMG